MAATTQLRHDLDAEREAFIIKEREVSALTEQLDQLREQLMDREEDVQQLTAQLDVAATERGHSVQHLEDAIDKLKAENSQLQSHVRTLQEQAGSSSMPVFAQHLLDEKNEEIDDLNVEIGQLKEDLSRAQLSVSGDVAQLTDTDTRRVYAELEDKSAQLDQRGEEIQQLQQLLHSMEEAQRLADQGEAGDNVVDEIRQQLDQAQDKVNSLGSQLDQTEDNLKKSQTSHEAEIAGLSSTLQEKENILEQLSTQVHSLQVEVENLTDFQAKLQEDYDTLQNLFDERDKTVETLTTELEHVRVQGDGISDLQLQYEAELETVQKQLREKQNVIEEKDEENYTISEQLEKQTEAVHQLQDQIMDLETTNNELETNNLDLESRKTELEAINRQLQQKMQADATGAGGETPGASGDAQTDLTDQIQNKEALIQSLRDELNRSNSKFRDQQDELNRAVSELWQLRNKLSRAQEQERKLNEAQEQLRTQLSEADEEDQQLRMQFGTAQDLLSAAQEQEKKLRTQLSTSQDELFEAQEQLNAAHEESSKQRTQHRTETEEMKRALVRMEHELQSQETNADMQQRLEELRVSLSEEHQRHINETIKSSELERVRKMEEMEASFSQTVESLRQQLQDEQQAALTELQSNMERSHQGTLEKVEREIQKRHSEEVNEIIAKHQREIQQIQASVDMAEEESVAEWTRTLTTAVEGTERTSRRIYGQDTGVSDKLQGILNKVHEEGIGVLSLSDMNFLQSLSHQCSDTCTRANTHHHDDVQVAWEEERESLLATVRSLRHLLSEMHKTREASKSELDGCDWRSDLLKAVHDVFAQENADALADLHTFKVINGEQVAQSVEQLEQRVQKLSSEHKSAHQTIMAADRQSLLAEIRELHSQVALLTESQAESGDHVSHQMAALEDEYLKKERHLKRQIQLLEYRVQQEKVLAEDLHTSLENQRSRSTELLSQLSREKISNTELSTEIVTTQTQLQKMKDALEREQQRLLSASSVLDEERRKQSSMTDALIHEQETTESYIKELEQERFRSVQLKDRTGEVIQKLKVDLETEKERHVATTSQLTREKMAATAAKRDLELERERNHSGDVKHKTKVSELRTALDMERARSNELNSALQRERHLVSQLRDTIDEERTSVQEAEIRERISLTDLQALLDLEKSRVLQLQNALERDSHKTKELQSAADRNSRKLLSLEEHNSALQRQVDSEKAACRQLKHTVDALQTRSMERSDYRSLYDRILAHNTELTAYVTRLVAEKQELRSTLSLLEEEVWRYRRTWLPAYEEEYFSDTGRHFPHRGQYLPRERQHLSSSLGQLPCEEGGFSRTLGPSEREFPRTFGPSEREFPHTLAPSDSQTSSSQRDSLDHVPGAYRGSATVISASRHISQPYSGSQSYPEGLSHAGESRSQTGAGQLYHYETSHLVNHQSHSRDTQLHTNGYPHTRECRPRSGEYHSYTYESPHNGERQSRTSPHSSSEVDKMDQPNPELMSERIKWSEDRADLTLRINDLESQLNMQKDALRRAEIDLEREREKYYQPQAGGNDRVDNKKVLHVYGQYLRAQSFRKALIYQKKYLLILLGGYQDTEEETLAALANMGAYPSPSDFMHQGRYRRPFTRFRGAVRAVIAIFRMKMIVKKWRQATRIGSQSLTTIVNGASYISSNSRLPHKYSTNHHPADPVNHHSRSALTSTSHTHLTTSHSHLPVTTNHSHQPTSNGHSFTNHSHSSRKGHRSDSAYPSTSSAHHPANHSKAYTSSAHQSRFSELQAHVDPKYRRDIRSALDPMPDPTPTPPPSLNGGGDTPVSTDVDGEEALNDYIQRLENLQARLGSVRPHNTPQLSHKR